MVQHRPDFYILPSLLLPYFFMAMFTRECGCVIIKLTNQERRILGLRKNTVEDALELVGLSEFGDRLAKKYSLGMKQRLGLAGALLG